MFGYIKPYIPQLRVCEYELYKAVYCGLCRQLGRSVSCRSRLTLNYDFVFLALLRFALQKETPVLSSSRCIAHPAKKRSVAIHSDILGFCASASILLTRAKLLDDIADNSGIKKAGAYAALPLVSDRHISDDMRQLEKTVTDKLAILSELESKRTASIDAPADIFGQVCSDVFSFGLTDEKSERIAKQIGIHIGRWIYVIDAADDFEKDKITKSYNPIVEVYGENFDSDSIKRALLLELSSCETAFELIDYNDPMIENILKNIIYLGMPNTAEKVFNKIKDGRKE